MNARKITAVYISIFILISTEANSSVVALSGSVTPHHGSTNAAFRLRKPVT